jgi:hypothetical protein
MVWTDYDLYLVGFVIHIESWVFAYNVQTGTVRNLTPTQGLRGCPPAVHDGVAAWTSIQGLQSVVTTYDLVRDVGEEPIQYDPRAAARDVTMSRDWIAWADFLGAPSQQIYVQRRH